jgi:DNA-binding GntR family transcriptional regulator
VESWLRFFPLGREGLQKPQHAASILVARAFAEHAMSSAYSTARDTCSLQKNCARGGDMQLFDKLDAEFKAALKAQAPNLAA